MIGVVLRQFLRVIAVAAAILFLGWRITGKRLWGQAAATLAAWCVVLAMKLRAL